MSFLATRRVFFRSIATVIGPTPPGTGVIKPAFFFTSKRKKKQAWSENASQILSSLSVSPTCLTGKEHKGLWLGSWEAEGKVRAEVFLQPQSRDRRHSGPGMPGAFLHGSITTRGLVLGHGVSAHWSCSPWGRLPRPHSHSPQTGTRKVHPTTFFW